VVMTPRVERTAWPTAAAALTSTFNSNSSAQADDGGKTLAHRIQFAVIAADQRPKQLQRRVRHQILGGQSSRVAGRTEQQNAVRTIFRSAHGKVSPEDGISRTLSPSSIVTGRLY